MTRVLVAVVFILGACATVPMPVQAPTEPQHVYVGLGVPGSAVVCFQQAPMGNWLCHTVEELRQMLWTLQKVSTE